MKKIKQLDWKKSTEDLPGDNETVLGFNERSGVIEFGFRSELDTTPESWIDFYFPVTHWAYANHPE